MEHLKFYNYYFKLVSEKNVHVNMSCMLDKTLNK